MESQTQEKKLREMVEGFHSAMLITTARDGEVRARPMAVANVESEVDVYFATSITSPKTEEIRKDDHVAITLQDASHFVSISGRAEIVRDRAMIEKFWNESWKVWFPEGKDDPSLCLVKVNATRAEYWDLTAPNRVRYLYEAAKAYLTGTTPKNLEGTHGEAKLAH